MAALLSLAWSAGCSSSNQAGRDADAPPLTASGDCRTRPERCNSIDDDCDGIIDERADTSCALAHAATSCVRGRCVIERCSESFFDCNDIMSDGCETKGECGACREDCDSAVPAEAMSSEPSPPAMPSSGPSDAGKPPIMTAEPPRTEPPQAEPARPASQAPDEADAGNDTDVSGSDSDAGPGCDADGCDSCTAAAPSGQGAACDQCLCESCPDALAACTRSADEEWNTLCGNLLECFGKSVQAGLCSGDDSDCYQNGDGPCATEFRAAFTRGWLCTADPVRTPCGALTRVRLECFQGSCASVCKP